MSKDVLARLGGLLLLIGAAFIRPGKPDVWVFGLLAFGILNLIVSIPGTAVVRFAAVVVSIVGLLLRDNTSINTGLLLLAWLIWPAALLTAWSVARRNDTTLDVYLTGNPRQGRKARITIAAIIVAVAIGSVAYRLLVARNLEQTAALFIGIPALLAIVVVFAVSPKSATGVACKAVTIGLLVSLLFLWEGMLCVIMSAPIFYAVAVLVGVAVSRARRAQAKPIDTALSCLVLLTLVPMSFEGVTATTSLNRDETVAETRIVRVSSYSVERALAQPPRFDRILPPYLRAGFPRPISTKIEGDSVGSRWIVRVRGGEMRVNGMESRVGDLVLEIEETQPGLVRWRAISDDSHMTHFLAWQEASVRWEAIGPQATRVTWTLRYRRSLDPAWYFGPWERYAARLAAGYLIDSVATP
jgi:hypothetical protein